MIGRKLLGAGVAAAVALFAASAATAAPPKPPTIEEYARLPLLSSVAISPDGKRVAAVTTVDGENTAIAIWDLDKPNAQPWRGGPPPRSSFFSVRFVKNDRLLVGIRQPITYGTIQTYFGRFFLMDLDGGNLMTALGDRNQNAENAPSILDDLPNDPRNVLVGAPDGEIFRVDVYNGQRARVYRGSDRFFAPQADLSGEIRARREFNTEGGRAYIAQFIRHPDTNAWEEHFRYYSAEREPIDVVAFTRDPNIVIVRTSAGRDKAALFEYDIRARKMLESAFEHPLFDADGVVQIRRGSDAGDIAGFRYLAHNTSTYWLDEQIDNTLKGVRQALGQNDAPMEWVDAATGGRFRIRVPEDAEIYLSGVSEDRRRFVITKIGPKQPAVYYLLTEGNNLRMLGVSRPWINPESLGDMRMVQYQARDGLMIPAFLTTPPKARYGNGPYPTIVVPHGGPWARDDLEWDNSGWVQYFAAQGYAVLQPQFRGSRGWGQKIWRAGDAEWGQKMQDDKDDGALWLVQQGIAAPGRIAMHGFSYGGYSSMVAALRPNGIYKCAVAGAGVADLAEIQRGVFGSRWLREFQAPTIQGLDPLRNVSQASIPIMVYTGTHDTVVRQAHSEKFANSMRAAGKEVKLVVIPELSHSAGDTPALKRRVLTEIETYLKDDCKL